MDCKIESSKEWRYRSQRYNKQNALLYIILNMDANSMYHVKQWAIEGQLLSMIWLVKK